ncbi:DUF3352 domain-containing protein [Pseudomonas seleniipraecipitans]|uniref:DUF3352 domain-containing protein n=1 Tax=Phytopseudomonas seleniipraecipitans TaxID=640205 RepID=A0ABY5JCI9_9GAMM|nr:hypothetical protein [Pseudomonas seleniipraecipitans]UUD65779.1 DUF3352 domain-containing protein [Pseudomonas seleniipraecipitans]
MSTIDTSTPKRVTGETGNADFDEKLREARSKGGQLDKKGIEAYKEHRGPYLDGKPPLAESNHQWKEEDIANVESEWLSSSGHRLMLWDDLLLVTMKNGDQVLVHAGVNPRLHEVAKAKMDSGDVKGAPAWTEKDLSDEHELWLGQREAGGFTVVTSPEDVPEIGDLRFIEDGYLDMSAAVYHPGNGFQLTVDDNGAYGENDTALFTTADGHKYAVSKEVSPDAYERVKELAKTRDEIEKKIDEDGYKVMSARDDIPVVTDDTKVETLAPGVLAVETPRRGKFIVIESVTPEHFANLEGTQVDKQQGAVDKAFEDRDLPPAKDTDLMLAETSEKKDGKAKTVGELYYDNLKEAYKDKPDDSKEAKYLRLLEARAMLNGGFQFLPYTTTNGAFSGTTNTSYGKDPKEMSPAEMRGLVDEGKLGEELLALMTDEDIAADNDRFLKEAIDKVKDKDGFKDKLAETLRDPEYKKALADLEQDNPEGAAARYAADMQSLSLLDAELAAQIDTEFKFGIPIDQLNELYQYGMEGVGEENVDKATTDMVSTLLTTMMTSVLGTKRGTDIYNYFFGGGKEKGQAKPELSAEEQKLVTSVESSREPLTQLLKDSAKASINDPSGQSGVITAEKIDKAVAKVPLAERDGVAGVLGKLGKTGVLSSSAGLISMVAGIYKLADGGLNFGDTPAERIEAAKNFVTTISMISPMATMVTGAYEELFRKPGAADSLGLGKSLKETVWDKHFKPKDVSETESIEMKEIQKKLDNLKELPELDMGKAFTADNFWKDFDDNTRTSRPAVEDLIEQLPADQQDAVRSSLTTIADKNPDLKNVPESEKLRWIGGALSTIGGVADVAGGVLDLVLGGMGIDKLRKEGGTPEQFAAKSLQLVGGTAGLVMGGAGLAAAIGVGSAAVAGVVAAAAGGVGAVLGFIGAIIGGVVALKKSEETVEKVRDYFRELDKDGVLEKEWGDKLNYLVHMSYEYNYYEGKYEDRFDAWYPEDIPVWEAQPEHYKEFTEKVEKDGKIGDDWFTDNMKDLVTYNDKFDAEFYRENKDKIDRIVDNWEQWQGSDDIISDKDFNKLLKGDDRFDNSQEDIDAVQFLMDNKEFFEFLDTIRFHPNNTKSDGKISRKDVDKWLEQVS